MTDADPDRGRSTRPAPAARPTRRRLADAETARVDLVPLLTIDELREVIALQEHLLTLTTGDTARLDLHQSSPTCTGAWSTFRAGIWPRDVRVGELPRSRANSRRLGLTSPSPTVGA